MERKSSLLIPALVLLCLMLLVSACNGSKNTDPVPDPVPAVCEYISDAEGKNRVKVCYRPNEVITNTSEYSEEEEAELFEYLTKKGLSQIDTCKCQQKLIRWGTDNRQEINVIGTVTDAPKNGGPQGDSATITANYLTGIPDFETPRKTFSKGDEKIVSVPAPIRASVTVIDTGVDSMGLGLGQNISTEKSILCRSNITDTPHGLDITAPSNSPIPFDWVGHGTHISGIIMDVMNPSPSIGIALRNVKVSEGGSSVIYLFEMLCGMYYALEKGSGSLDVMNCSLGWEDIRMPEVMRPLLHEMERMGVLLVAGAGNNGAFQCSKDDVLFWPAAFSNAYDSSGKKVVISIGAWDEVQERLWEHSNQCFDVAAPGVDIISSFLYSEQQVSGLQHVHNSAMCSGTSMAAAYVSRVAAEIKADNPTFTPEQIKACIIQSAALLPKRVAPDASQEVRVLLGVPTTCKPRQPGDEIKGGQ